MISKDEAGLLATLFLVGVATGIGKLFVSDERITPRRWIGRALTTGVLAMSSPVVLIWLPETPDYVLYGITATIASLGTSFLEAFVQKYLGTRMPK